MCKTFKPSERLRGISEGVGSFSIPEGFFLESYKTALTRKALSYLSFRKTKSEKHIVSDLFGYSGSTKRRMRPCYVPSISNNVSVDGFLTVEILCNGDV